MYKRIKRELKFKSGRLRIFEAVHEDYDIFQRVQLDIAFTTLSSSLLLKSLIYWQYFQGPVWAGLLYVFTKSARVSIPAYRTVIDKIDLHEDGQHVDLWFYDKAKLTVSINTI